MIVHELIICAIQFNRYIFYHPSNLGDHKSMESTAFPWLPMMIENGSLTSVLMPTSINARLFFSDVNNSKVGRCQYQTFADELRMCATISRGIILKKTVGKISENY